MKSFLLEQLQKNVMLFDITTDQLMAWVGDWQEQVPELYNPNFQIFSVYAFWGAGIYLLWAVKKQTLNFEEKDRCEELERIFVRAETKAEIATHLFQEKVTSELDSFFNRVAKWWQGKYNPRLNSLKTEEKMSELKLAVAYILYRREQMWFAALAIERQCLRGTTKLVANLKSMSEFLVDPAIKSLCQEYHDLFEKDGSDPWFPEEFWWRKMCPFQEDSLSLSVSIEKKTAPKESWLDFLDKSISTEKETTLKKSWLDFLHKNGGIIMKEELWKLLYTKASELQKTLNCESQEEEWERAKKIAEMALVVAEETFETDSPELEQSSRLVKSFEATKIDPNDDKNGEEDGEKDPVFEARQRLEEKEKALGPDHPDLMKEIENLAVILSSPPSENEEDVMWRYLCLPISQVEEAEKLFRRALAIKEKNLGPDHPDLVKEIENLANIILRWRKDEEGEDDKLSITMKAVREAENLYSRALAIKEKNLGPEHLEVAKTLQSLAITLQNTYGGYGEETEALYKRIITIKEKAFGQNHLEVAQAVENLADFYSGPYAPHDDRYDEKQLLAERLYGRACLMRRKLKNSEIDEW